MDSSGIGRTRILKTAYLPELHADGISAFNRRSVNPAIIGVDSRWDVNRPFDCRVVGIDRFDPFPVGTSDFPFETGAENGVYDQIRFADDPGGIRAWK